MLELIDLEIVIVAAAGNKPSIGEPVDVYPGRWAASDFPLIAATDSLGNRGA